MLVLVHYIFLVTLSFKTFNLVFYMFENVHLIILNEKNK